MKLCEGIMHHYSLTNEDTNPLQSLISLIDFTALGNSLFSDQICRCRYYVNICVAAHQDDVRSATPQRRVSEERRSLSAGDDAGQSPVL